VFIGAKIIIGGVLVEIPVLIVAVIKSVNAKIYVIGGVYHFYRSFNLRSYTVSGVVPIFTEMGKIGYFLAEAVIQVPLSHDEGTKYLLSYGTSEIVDRLIVRGTVIS
jgi:hypothetical protein